MAKVSSGRIPSLDGMRAVAISLVIVFHVTMLHPLPVLWRFNIGNLGVRAFFVISGFLISTLLLREHARSGTISLKNFYIRRAFRILPAYYTMLALVYLMVRVGAIRGSGHEMLPALFYFSNYKLPLVALRHTWSLSVEEQFYLLWPLTLVALGVRRASIGCVALLFVAPFFRVLSDLGYWHLVAPGFAFECVCDALAVGCLMAMHREKLWTWKPYRTVVESPLAVSIAAFALIFMAAQPPLVLRDTIGVSTLNIGIAVLIDRYMRKPRDTRIGALLNFTPVVWIGTISYSLYLWQQPWLFSGLPSALALAGTVGCAALSYYLVEKPALALCNQAVRGRRFPLPAS